MEFKKVKRNVDAKKVIDVESQSKQEKKSETSEQRLWRNTRLLKAVGTGLMLGMAGMVEATSGEGSNQVTELANQHSSKLPEFSLQQAMQEERRLQEKMSNFPFHFNGPEEVASREETSRQAEDLSSLREARGLSLKKKVKVKLPDSRSRKMASGKETPQSRMETHQGEQDKDKGKGPSETSLKAEKPQQRSSLNANPEVRQQLKKLNDKQVRERSLLESNPENACRRLNLAPDSLTYTYTQLNAADAQAQLEYTQAFKDARQYLGKQPDWNNIYVFNSTDLSGNAPPTREGGIVAIYPSEGYSTTFLAIDNPSAGNDTLGLLGQFVVQSKESASLTWSTPQGKPFAAQFQLNGWSGDGPAEALIAGEINWGSSTFSPACFIRNAVGGGLPNGDFSDDCKDKCIASLFEDQSSCYDDCILHSGPFGMYAAKQCLTTASSDQYGCLNVSLSGVDPKVQLLPDMIEISGEVYVQNNCPWEVNYVAPNVDFNYVCPPRTCPPGRAYYALNNITYNPTTNMVLNPGESKPLLHFDTWVYCSTFNEAEKVNSVSLPTTIDVNILAFGGTPWVGNEFYRTVYSPNRNFHVYDASMYPDLNPSPALPSACGDNDPDCTQLCARHPDADIPSTQPASLPSSGTPSIVFIHGFKPGPDAPGKTPPYTPTKGDGSGFSCTEYWGDAKTFLSERGLGGDLRTIKYYNGDRDCDNGAETRYSYDLHHPLYSNVCNNYPEGYSLSVDGTNDESIYHLSCLFAQYLNSNFGQSNREVMLVGHSMGGLIMRETLYQMQKNAGPGRFPSTIGYVTKAITFNTPHEGSVLGRQGSGKLSKCDGCQQGIELTPKSDLLTELATFGRNPQTSAGFTEWTEVGSQCDFAVLPASSSVGMDANHAVVYSGHVKVGPIKDTPTCYDHGGALHDDKTEHDAEYYYCDTSDPNNNACTDQYQSSRWSKTKTGLHGLELLYSAIVGCVESNKVGGNKMDVNASLSFCPQPSTADRAGSSPRLWMAATIASVWALLARQRI
jgi:hypothetical protein